MSANHSAQNMRRGRVTANGIEFGILEAGSGPLALCLHGFPDSAHTWRHLLPELAQAGFHAVAPFMRGYAPTALAVDGCYQLGALVADAVALHDALGGDEQAVLIGQDWGAETGYGAAALAPERWRKLVTIAVPPAPLDARIFGDYQQLRRFFYIFFMKTARAEAVIAADDMAFLDRLWEDWSPGYDATEDLRNAKQCLRAAGHLSAAIGYYRADEPGCMRTSRTTPTPPSTQRCSGSRLNRRCTSTEIATAASTSRSSPTPRVTSPRTLEWRSSKASATSYMSSVPAP
jgi:pimeloyl-ACP methyl ester carboxylesterase